MSTFRHGGHIYHNWNLDNPETRAELESAIGSEAAAGIIMGEERRARIEVIRDALAGTDYKAIKYAERQLSDEEYAETKIQRQAWREEINALEMRAVKEGGGG